MEKIYEEKNNSQRTSQINVSVVLSFVVAAFAIVSLVAFGFDQISYADPSAGVGAASESMTVKYKKSGSDEIRIIALKSGGGYAGVPVMIDGSGNPVFCIEYGEPLSNDGNGTDYEPEKDGGKYVSDPGISYILGLDRSQVISANPKYPDQPAGSTVTAGAALEELDQQIYEVYVRQLAIWYYQIESGKYTTVLNDTTIKDIFESPINLTASIYTNGATYTRYIASGNVKNGLVNKIVTDALSAAASGSSSTKTVTLNLKSDNVKQLDDEQTYSSDEFSVVGSGLTGYKVSLSGDLADDAYVVSGGNKISSTAALAPTDKFYVYVPKNKLSEEKKGVTVYVEGAFTDTEGVFYSATDSQRVVKLREVPKTAEARKKIFFMVTPDTGLSTAQTIYFIGLIVLLCGVGIIYANAKPVEEK